MTDRPVSVAGFRYRQTGAGKLVPVPSNRWAGTRGRFLVPV